ncbi:DR1-associated protein 1 (negative cofactor 2 alpha) [Mortierella sp. GBA43]|nr:DR1-associated protein 1 (negative cofactor 2 alpha) [Mortierella sp. GBA43]
MRKKYRTKFPVARIKKIMQMDEDVGKVAQATPILISKALELFMQSLIDEACIETRAKNAKRLTAAHLKKTILDKDQFDFLRDIVQNVPDPQAGSGSGAADEANHSGSGGGSSSSGSNHQNQSSSSSKMEVDDKSYAEFAGAMAAAKRGAPKAPGPKKPAGRASAKDDEDDDYDNE